MLTTFLKSTVKLYRRHKSRVFMAASITLLSGIVVYANYMNQRTMPLDPAVFRPLLNLIAKVESNGNYNAYFGNANNQTVDFTSMTVAEVLAWQKDYVANGSSSSAVGRYQIINTTLSSLVDQLGIRPSEKFDENMQDRMAVALLERRGAREYLNNRISQEEFAANLAKEWAALPKVVGENPNESYYAADGLNKSRVAVHEVLRAIERVNS